MAAAKSECAMKLCVESEITFNRMRLVNRIRAAVISVSTNDGAVGKNTGMVSMPMRKSRPPDAALRI
ncbi:hypothetical protein D3C80_2086980 [compost metagenome]